MTDDVLLEVLNETADAVAGALGGVDDWGLSGRRPGQYHSDLAADAAALAVLDRAEVGVLSEESGVRHGDRPVLVVLDPLDGSTNASRGLPWFATSLCAVDRDGCRAAVVLDLVSGARYEAVRAGGARRDGTPIGPSGCRRLEDAVVGLSGFPPRHFGWWQYRALGGAALALCAVADGRLDAYVDCDTDVHAGWDYLGGVLVCREAGAPVVDAGGRDLVVRAHDARRTPVAAATPELLDRVMAERGWC